MGVFRKLDSGEKDFSRCLYHEFLMEHRVEYLDVARTSPPSSHSICLLDVHSRLTAPCIICARVGWIYRIVAAYYENLTWELADKFYVNGNHRRTWDPLWETRLHGSVRFWRAIFFLSSQVCPRGWLKCSESDRRMRHVKSPNNSITLAKHFSFYVVPLDANT